MPKQTPSRNEAADHVPCDRCYEDGWKAGRLAGPDSTTRPPRTLPRARDIAVSKLMERWTRMTEDDAESLMDRIEAEAAAPDVPSGSAVTAASEVPNPPTRTDNPILHWPNDPRIPGCNEHCHRAAVPDAALQINYNLGRTHGWEEGYRAAAPDAALARGEHKPPTGWDSEGNYLQRAVNRTQDPAGPAVDVPAALDVETLARAMKRTGTAWTDDDIYETARVVAVEYARLQNPDQ